MDPATGLLAESGNLGADLETRYHSADPFPHVVIDHFLPDPVLDICLAEFGKHEGEEFSRAQELRKRQYNPDTMSAAARTLFYSFNSRPFISVVENITGIKGLLPDPYFLGGGLHEIANGGHLSVHADFNHHKPLGVERRINLLIYLNDDWREEYGGQLELWDRGMEACCKSIIPIRNRCVIFNTTSTSYHGNPQPVNTPDGRSRKSIALYYYTATWTGTRRSHTTQFKVRPGSADQTDWTVRRSELADDLLPPIVKRAAKRLLRGRGSRR
jgi:hypothetical protein